MSVSTGAFHLSSKKMGPILVESDVKDDSFKEMTVLERLKASREQLAEELSKIDTTISLLERNPQFDLILTEVKKVMSHP